MTGVENYLNTIIFCVVAKMITIIVLGLIILPQVRAYAIFLLTIELGLVTIIIWSLWKISRYEKRMAEELQKIRESSMTTLACPDFFERGTGLALASRNSNGTELKDASSCGASNDTTLEDSELIVPNTANYTVCKNMYTTPDGKYEYYIGPKNNTNSDEINMITINLDTDYHTLNVAEACRLYGSNDDFYPWTDLTSKCGVIS